MALTKDPPTGHRSIISLMGNFCRYSRGNIKNSAHVSRTCCSPFLLNRPTFYFWKAEKSPANEFGPQPTPWALVWATGAPSQSHPKALGWLGDCWDLALTKDRAHVPTPVPHRANKPCRAVLSFVPTGGHSLQDFPLVAPLCRSGPAGVVSAGNGRASQQKSLNAKN